VAPSTEWSTEYYRCHITNSSLKGPSPLSPTAGGSTSFCFSAGWNFIYRLLRMKQQGQRSSSQWTTFNSLCDTASSDQVSTSFLHRHIYASSYLICVVCMLGIQGILGPEFRGLDEGERLKIRLDPERLWYVVKCWNEFFIDHVVATNSSGSAHKLIDCYAAACHGMVLSRPEHLPGSTTCEPPGFPASKGNPVRKKSS